MKISRPARLAEAIALFGLVVVALPMQASAMETTCSPTWRWRGLDSGPGVRCTLSLTHLEAQTIANARGQQEVAAALSAVVLTPLIAPLFYGAVFSLREQVRSHDHGDGVMIAFQYFQGAANPTAVGLDVDVGSR